VFKVPLLFFRQHKNKSKRGTVTDASCGILRPSGEYWGFLSNSPRPTATFQNPCLVAVHHILSHLCNFPSRNCSVGIALGYELDDRGSGVRFPTGLGIFPFATASRTALEPTQSSIQWESEALSLGVKRRGREADHSPPSSAEVKECVELYIISPNTPSWRGA
jgi:hypothetical protein